MSNTARKVRRRRTYWDFIATKALLLGDDKAAAAANGNRINIRGGANPSEAWEHVVYADEWLLQQMNIRATRNHRDGLRNALRRLRIRQ